MDAVGKIFEYFGVATPFMYAAGAYGFFAWLDANLSDNAKAELARAAQLRMVPNDQAASALVEVFDRIYTSPLLHWRAAWRSLLFTLILTAIFAYEVSGSEAIQDLKTSVDQHVEMKLYAVAFAANAASDYLSLFLIRPWLARFGRRPVFAMLSATLLAILVVVLGAFVRLELSGDFSSGPYIAPPDHPLKHDPSDFRPADIAVYTKYSFALVSLNFLASVPAAIVFLWLLLFAVGLMFLRALTPFAWMVAKAQWSLKDGEEHPLRAVGCVVAVIVFAVAMACRIL
jgi:hypothetical protein